MDAVAYGIKNPVAMTLQDAGWTNGPWIGNGNSGYQPTHYKTWRDYIENHSIKTPTQNWKFSQEDVMVSLVWGSQVMQQLAQRVRIAENKIVRAEKMAALANVYDQKAWLQSLIDEAWRALMLAQHHDCWIVPYNGRRGDTWADKVKVWTKKTNDVSDSIINAVSGQKAQSSITALRVYNTTGKQRNEVVRFAIPVGMDESQIAVVDENGKEILSQVVMQDGKKEVYFKSEVPAFGYKMVGVEQKSPKIMGGALATLIDGGDVVLETDLYKLIIDKSKGGAIKSLIAKSLKNKEFVDVKNEKGFNELRGYFYNDGGFHSTSENPVTISIVENGPVVVKAEIRGMILNHPYTQTLTLKQGDRIIDCSLKIDWQKNVGIGDDYKQNGGLDSKDYRKPFYDDSKKLLALFPVAFSSQKVYKDAPFDVTESKLNNTFFTTWDNIKNNLVLNWVDVYDAQKDYGLALLTDHTTTYAHGENFPLGLNIQYSGAGLWGRNHTITGPTQMKYALVPHKGKWDESGISTEAVQWNEPLIALSTSEVKETKKSLVDVTGTGYQVTTVLVDNNDLLVRLFNADGNGKVSRIVFGGSATEAQLEELNGTVKQKLKMQKDKSTSAVQIAMPRFGIRTIRLKNFTAF